MSSSCVDAHHIASTRSQSDMGTRRQPSVGQRAYHDFVPPHRLIQEEEADTIVVSLEGFVKEELNVQLDSDGRVVVSGQRPTMDGRWSRFRKEFRVPENCVLDKISAKFENGLLHLVFPKSMTKPSPQDDGSIRKQGGEEKVGKQEKDQVKEDKPGDGEKKAAARAASRGVGLRLRQMKLEMGRLERELRDTRNGLMLALAVAAVVSVGVGLYLNHKLTSTHIYRDNM